MIPSTTSFHVKEECYMKKQRIKISLKILRICFSPILRQRRLRAIDTLTLVNEELVTEEENVARLQECDHVILKEKCSYYLVNSEFQETLVAAIVVASGFVTEL
ncbi:hypothetical protein F2Q69_00009483 [Brassica cretica]|uniref:Uncharacterized protein n=1 Tax=Brassica cretica TaxID=69181 RepID=A0A8S9P790_BRACR|nr:hypothetical protein F2Q69_00009483 [Brassica cretica]